MSETGAWPSKLSSALPTKQAARAATSAARRTPTREHRHEQQGFAVTLAFRVIEICATTLGETGGDVLSMTLGLGYVASSAVFIGLFVPAMLA